MVASRPALLRIARAAWPRPDGSCQNRGKRVTWRGVHVSGGNRKYPSVVSGERNTTEDDFGGMYELDLTEVEREICRLPDVSISRLVAEPSGRVSEVHIVAHAGKHPKQIARDVQSIALASFGLELDRRIISVVQLGGDVLDAQMVPPYLRPSVVAITAEANGLRSLVRVTPARGAGDALPYRRRRGARGCRRLLPARRCRRRRGRSAQVGVGARRARFRGAPRRGCDRGRRPAR